MKKTAVAETGILCIIKHKQAPQKRMVSKEKAADPDTKAERTRFTFFLAEEVSSDRDGVRNIQGRHG